MREMDMTDNIMITNMINEIKGRPPRVSGLDKQIGNNTRLLRLRKNITLKALASALGISIQQLCKYEQGKNRISAGRLLVISETLGVDIATMYKDQTIFGKNGTYLKLFEKVNK